MSASPSGTGKSHLVEALTHAAIEKDLRVAWFTLETLASRRPLGAVLEETPAFQHCCDELLIRRDAE
jgi:putative protein kinase ArgK-like GTPase of G3E family